MAAAAYVLANNTLTGSSWVGHKMAPLLSAVIISAQIDKVLGKLYKLHIRLKSALFNKYKMQYKLGSDRTSQND